MSPSVLDELRGRREVESFLAERHVFWRSVPHTYDPMGDEGDGVEFMSNALHWIKTGYMKGGDVVKEMKKAIGFFRRMFKSRSVTGKHVVAITPEHVERFPILGNYKEVVIERRGGKRQVQIV